MEIFRLNLQRLKKLQNSKSSNIIKTTIESRNILELKCLIKNPHLEEEHFQELLKIDDWSIRAKTVSHPKFNPQRINILSTEENYFVKRIFKEKAGLSKI